ncbi:MAG: energy transducer TonB [Caulobacteraceae bacterium]
MARYYPPRAQSLNKSGRATISCTVTEKGTLTGCSVVNEDPPDFDFGDASLKLAHTFRMKPKMQDGQPVAGGTVRIPIRWNLAG